MNLASFPQVMSVHVEPWESDGQTGFSVGPLWGGVDRPYTSGWVVKTKALATRLEKAIMAGVVCVDAKIAVDNAGKTYVQSTSKVMSKYMNADLRRLGF